MRRGSSRQLPKQREQQLCTSYVLMIVSESWEEVRHWRHREVIIQREHLREPRGKWRDGLKMVQKQ
jgi:hypothetical protein